MTRQLMIVMFITLGAPLLCSPVFGQSLEIIQLQHRSAEDLLPLLQPLLNDGGALTGQGDRLFMRASASSAANIRQALRELDRTPRELLISVRKGTFASGDERAIAGELHLQTAQPAPGLHRDNSSIQLQTDIAQGSEQADAVTQVRVLEGSGAFIMTGQSVPTVSSFLYQNGRAPLLQSSTRYRQVQSGFSVVPHIAGGEVILEISQQTQTARSSVQGTIDTQQLSTTVAGRVGEWIPVGGIDETSSRSSAGIGATHLETQHDANTLWVRVEIR
jgi:hypothetical protein